jgi:hypothetical protein
MASLQTYSKKSFVERIKRDLHNGIPDSDFSISDNEILFHVDQAIAYAMVGSVYNLAKLEGTLTVPEAYISRFSITDLSKNEVTGEWYATLPQPPISLPLGYSITDVFFAKEAYGRSEPVMPLEAKVVSYRDMLPKPKGVTYYVQGSTIYLKDSEGSPLRGLTLYVEMVKTRTVSWTEEISLPDDAIQNVYVSVMDALRKRIINPQDNVQDGLPASPKTQ